MNHLEYKGYYGSIEYGKEDKRLYGSVLGMTKDSITFEGNTVEELENDFIDAIESYLEGCKELGIKPRKGYNGVLSIRIPSKIHGKIAMISERSGISINAFIRDSIEKRLESAFFSLFIIATLMTFTGCTPPKSQLELVKDTYGVTYQINPTEKFVYLIFTGHFSTDDDGYFENFDGADEVLITMAEHGVKGSFFPTGNCFRVERYQPVIRSIIDQGHYLSGHSDRHLLLCAYEDRNINLVTLDSLSRDIANMELELEKFGLTKEQYLWLVPPYEYYNQFSADALRTLGYKLANPTEGLVTSMDWMGPDHPQYHSAEQLVNNIWNYEKEHTLNGAIILIHAMDYPDREDIDRPYRYLGEIISRLKDLGYGFKTFKDVIANEQ